MKRFFRFLLCSVLFVSSIGCSKSKTPEYHFTDGIIGENESIEDYYTLEGEKVCKGISIYDQKHQGSIIAVYESSVAGGGVVVWNNQYYSYSEDASKDATAYHLIEYRDLK